MWEQGLPALQKTNPDMPVKSWFYFSGYPGLCFIYLVGGSLDFFHEFYDMVFQHFPLEEISFQTIQKGDRLLCELQLFLHIPEDTQKLRSLLNEACLQTALPSISTLKDRHRALRKEIVPFLLSSFSTDFFYARPAAYLQRLTRALFHAQMNLMESSNKALTLRLTKACIKAEHEMEHVLGIIIGIRQSAIDQEGAMRAVQLLLPGAAPVSNSSMIYEPASQVSSLLYFEIRKMRGGPFSLHELTLMRKQLPSSLHNIIASKSEKTYFPKNEESISHEALRLAHQLQSIDDWPQLAITFLNVKQSRILFNIIIAYTMRGEELLEKKIEANLPTVLTYTLKHKVTFGYLYPNNKKYLKLGLVFDLELEDEFFLNYNGTINLIEARGYIAKTLEEIIGPFRDCNGGLLEKQNQQFTNLKEKVALMGLGHPSTLEKFFNSLTPSSLQATLSVEIVTKLFKLLLEQLKETIGQDQKYLFKTRVDGTARLLVIKVKEKTTVMTLQRQAALYINSIGFSGSAVLNIEDCCYFCFFENSRTDDSQSLISTLLTVTKMPLATASHQKIIRLNFHFGLPLSLNPQIIGDFRTVIIYKALFEGLTRINREGNVELAAAHNVEISDCKTRYLFHLRKSQWSNGENLTAHHFVFAWKKALSPHSGCPRADIFYPILHAEKIKKGELSEEQLGVEAHDSETLVIHLTRPSEYFLELLAHPHCSPLYGEYSEPHIFNGPFMCSSLLNGQQLRLIRNPFYWDAKHVALHEVRITTHQEPDEVLKLFENGQCDYIGDPFSPLPSNIYTHCRTQKLVWRPLYLYCNTSCFPLSNSFLRNAMSLSINRKEIANAMNWHPSILASPIPFPFSLQEKAQEDPFNPQQASHVFEIALQDLGIDRHSFPPLTLTIGNSETFKEIAEILKRQWQEALDIVVSIEVLEWDLLYSKCDHGRYQLGMMFQTTFYSDPLFYLKMFDDESALINRSRWKDQTYHGLIEKVIHSVGVDEYRSILCEAEKRLMQEMPVIPLLNQTYNYLLNRRIRNLSISNIGYIDLKEIFIDDSIQ